MGSPGRPCAGTERVRVTIKNVTLCKLNRLAKAWGFKKCKGAKPYLGSVVDKILESIETEEPEYLKLAKAANALKH